MSFEVEICGYIITFDVNWAFVVDLFIVILEILLEVICLIKARTDL